MTTARHRRRAAAAFTLVEMLTAIAILSILMVFVSLLFTAASKATQLSRERLDADRQARLIFDCMADDFTRMLRRPDVDFHFVKGSVAATPGVNDEFYMFCENSGYFGSGLTSSTESNMSLVGYRINTINNPPADSPSTLERLAKGLTWDVQGTTNPVAFLTLDNLPTNFAPDTASTILGQWPNIDQPTYADTNFHMLGDSTFRLAFCYLLTDGTYSLYPALSTPSAPTALYLTTGPPAPSNGYPNYLVGSRWYDTTHSQGYICTSAPYITGSNLAVWQPLGMSDVQAVVVAVAILDQTSQKMIGVPATALPLIAAQLANPTAANLTSSPGTPPQLMATTWLTKVNSAGFAALVGLPPAAAAQVRIYQRYFYLNNLYNNL